MYAVIQFNKKYIEDLFVFDKHTDAYTTYEMLIKMNPTRNIILYDINKRVHILKYFPHKK